MSREWSPMRAAYMPRVWPTVTLLCIFNGVVVGVTSYLIGHYIGPTAQWVAFIPLVALSSWSGNVLVNRRWDKWRAENPERPVSDWQWEAER